MDEFITTSQLREELGVSYQTARSLLQDAVHTQVGNVRLYNRSDVIRLVHEKHHRLVKFLELT